MDLAKESDNDSEINQVLMYFKKYSQNPELSKYFTGPEASISKPNNPSSKDSLKSTNKSSTSNVHTNITSADSNILQINQDEDTENKNISPSSSIASNKKLEWDNGADIGYNNSYKNSARKSASFPSLFVNDMSNMNDEKSISKNTKQMRSMYHQLTFSPEPSCSSTKVNIKSSSPVETQITIDTSPSLNEATSKEPSSLSTGSEKSKLYLQKEIGQPVAYSTPFDDAVSSKSSDNAFYRETPMLRIQSKPKRNLNKEPSEGSSGNYLSSDDKIVLHKDKSNSNSESCNSAVSNEKNQQASGISKCTEESVQKMYKVQREINLCLTKPIFVECIYSGPKQNINKKSQTSFVLGKNSKSVQTELIQIDNKIIYSNPTEVCTPLIQKIEYVRYKNEEPECNLMLSGKISLEVGNTETLFEESNDNLSGVLDLRKVENSLKKNSLKISTKKEDMKTIIGLDSNDERLDMTNKSDLEYIHDKSGNMKVIKTTKESIISNNSSISCPENISGSPKFKKVFWKSESTAKGSSPIDATDKSVSDEIILSEMISLNHSRDLNTDIKRSINILQKLLSSKKYDEATKKYYIKKIVEKIVESKYSDDSSSSSELFRPKRSKFTGLCKEDKTHIPSNKSVKSTENEIKLMQNIPWYPVCDTKHILSKKKKNMGSKVTKRENYTDVRKYGNTVHYFPKVDVDLMMDEKLKVTHDSEPLKKELLMENSECNIKDIPTKSSTTCQSSKDIGSEQPQPASTTDKMENKKWKNVKTLSERLLENRDKIGQGDYLLHVATNERNHQLSWIKNEIEHLNKLKEMLERKIKPKPPMEDVVSSLLKMHVDDLKGLAKNHEVFLCECSSATKGQCKCDCLAKTSGNKKTNESANRKSGYYTIQTQLDRHGNLLDLTVYDEKGTETYNYKQDGVADDVLVTSKNRNTSIKLKPRADKQLGYMKSKECKCCGQFFSAPVDNPELCCCFKCLEANTLKESQKIISINHLNICACQKCFEESKQNNQEITNSRCLFKACSTSNTSLKFKFNLFPPKSDGYLHQLPALESKCSCQKVTFSEPLDECICPSKDLVTIANRKLNRNSPISGSSTPMSSDEDSDKSDGTKVPPNCDVCPRCRRKSLRCTCYPKFVPKQPKLMGRGPKFDSNKLNFVEKGRHENKDDAKINSGRSYRSDSKPAPQPKPPPTRTTSTSPELKSETMFPRTKKVPLDVKLGKDVNIERKKKQRDESSGRNQYDARAVIPTAQSQLKPSKKSTNPTEQNSESQAKKVQCCKACKRCNSSSPVSPPLSEAQGKYKEANIRDVHSPPLRENNIRDVQTPPFRENNIRDIQTPPFRENNIRDVRTPPLREKEGEKNVRWKCLPKCLEKPGSSEKKGCQCCTCTDCGIQTKRLGDKNARCQCCVCENCGTQAALDGNNRKPILSKWCQLKKSEIQVLRTTLHPYSDKTSRRTQRINDNISYEVYSSSNNQARPDFRSSPRMSNKEIAPNSAGWLPNQTMAGDTDSTTQSKKKSQSKRCCCNLEVCKCSQTSTHEDKHVQYSAFKQCICQTESKEDANVQCACKGEVNICCQCEKQSCQCEKQSCQCVKETVCKCKQSSSSSSSSSSGSNSKSLMSCICCKKEKLLKNIMNKLPLCNPCKEIHQKSFYPYEYSNPLHSCLCYSLIDQDTMSELKSTLTELERLEIYQQYCEVLKNCECCKECGCKCRLPKKFKNGCAYFLKFEDACPDECREQEVCSCVSNDEEKKENQLPEVTVKVPNCKGLCRSKKNEIKMQPSVMAYLCTMKPQFIERAERRRKILRNAALQREEDGETRKLRFLDQVNYQNQKYQSQHVSNEYAPYGNQAAEYCVFDIGLNAPRNIKPRVFKSFKEMQDLTRKRYLHLSEVRNKKDVYKNKRLKEANRILANTFTKRLQRSTLRGNVDIPPFVRVISY